MVEEEGVLLLEEQRQTRQLSLQEGVHRRFGGGHLDEEGESRLDAGLRSESDSEATEVDKSLK